jgi:hypothetical protein
MNRRRLLLRSLSMMEKWVLVCGDHKKMVIIDGEDEEIAELFSFQLCFVFVFEFGMNFVSGSERAYGIVAWKENV